MHMTLPRNSMAEDSKGEFDTFVKAQQKSAQDRMVDWDKERDQWLGRLDALYQVIEEFLVVYVKDGQILLRYQDVSLNEEDLGTYCARRLIIRIGGKEIVLEPIGTRLIGGKGRVDVTGPAGFARLVLVDRDAMRPRDRKLAGPVDWTWKLVTPPPIIQYIELVQASLFRALLEVSGG
jgi:hypothetical protein